MAMCPGDTTEWDDIQRKFGNLPPLEREAPQRELDERLVESADSWLCRNFRCDQFLVDLVAKQTSASANSLT